jgi:hypothetical protein
MKSKIVEFINKKISVWFYLITISTILAFGFIFSWIYKNSESVGGFYPTLQTFVENTMYPIDRIISNTIYIYNSIKLDDNLEIQIINPQEIGGIKYPLGFRGKKNLVDSYILVSAYDKNNGVSSIFLFDQNTHSLIKSWYPKLSNIYQTLENHTLRTYELQENFRSQHPILTNDGGVIFSSGEGMMIKLNEKSNLEWSNTRHFHHSIEYGLEENTYISQIIMNEPLFLKDGREFSEIRNDGYVIFDGSGMILEERSIAQILYDNGYEGLLFGQSKWEKDRVHLNDAEFITKTDSFVKRGDIMLSSRHLSTVFLYRPSTDKIIWLKTGPFLHQHDINYLGDGEFSILGNDNIRNPNNDAWAINEYSSIYIYDMKYDKIYKNDLLTKIKMRMESEGRLKILNNNLFFINNKEQALIVDRNGEIIFGYSHPFNENSIGAMHWSRFYYKLPGYYN